jgi:hypothetical protein
MLACAETVAIEWICRILPRVGVATQGLLTNLPENVCLDGEENIEEQRVRRAVRRLVRASGTEDGQWCERGERGIYARVNASTSL